MKHSPQRIIYTVLVVVSLLFAVYLLRENSKKEQYQYHQGKVFGTIYHIVYQSERSYMPQIDSLLRDFDASLSSYNKTSVISKVNRNESVVLDRYFIHLFEKATMWTEKTHGAFDMTITPLIDAWGFGSGRKLASLTPAMVDSLLQYVGMDKIRLVDGKILKKNPQVQLNVNAVAKGYGVDVVADYLETCGVQNYLVEIGGEIRALGKNEKHRIWTAAINKPIDDSTQQNMEIGDDRILMPIGAMATSGNYRNFYIKDGKKYAHTINPKTGYPVAHKLLSATVCMPTCLDADALATAFMVLGVEEGKSLAEELQIPVYFIYDNKGKYETYISSKFREKLKK